MGQGTAESMKFCEKLLETQLKFAKHLGARGILTVPGGMTDEISLDRSYKNSVKTLKELRSIADEYAKSGITTGVENVWNAFFTSPYDMARFVDELGAPFSAYFDLGNVIAFSKNRRLGGSSWQQNQLLPHQRLQTKRRIQLRRRLVRHFR